MYKRISRIVFSFLVVIGALVTMGCATKMTYQIDGMPLPDNVIQTRILSLDLKLKYNFVNHYKVKEGDEYFHTWEYLSFFNNNNFNVVEEPTKLCININVFNPSMSAYSIVTTMEVEGEPLELDELYKGNISRNNIAIELPLLEEQAISFYFTLYDKDGNLLFQSFKARYIIEGH